MYRFHPHRKRLLRREGIPCLTERLREKTPSVLRQRVLSGGWLLSSGFGRSADLTTRPFSELVKP